MQSLLIGRNGHLFIIDAVLYENRGLILLAVVRSCIDSFLHCKEISASVLCHDEIIIHNVLSQFRYDLDYLRKKKVHDLACTGDICMGIIHLAVRMLRVGSLLDPHVIFT